MLQHHEDQPVAELTAPHLREVGGRVPFLLSLKRLLPKRPWSTARLLVRHQRKM